MYYYRPCSPEGSDDQFDWEEPGATEGARAEGTSRRLSFPPSLLALSFQGNWTLSPLPLLVHLQVVQEFKGTVVKAGKIGAEVHVPKLL